jgi:hypothetical protein
MSEQPKPERPTAGEAQESEYVDRAGPPGG